MSERRDQLTDEVIARFLRTRSADAERALQDQIMRTVGVTPQDRPWPGLGPILLPRRTLLLIAMALLIATMGAIAVSAGLLRPDPLPADRMTVIGQVIDAVNRRDIGSLRSSFVSDGTLEIPAVDARAGREGDVFMSDGWRPNDDWLRLVDPWGLEARLGSCSVLSEATISCAVVTGWHVLQIEIGEEWIFDFEGASVKRLQMIRVDPDPANRELPLGLVDLQGWEAWLQVTHPEQAEHLLPTGPDPFGHWYFRFGLDASPDEIGESIREYIRAGLPGPEPVSVERMTVIRQVIDAINDRDVATLRSTFAPDAIVVLPHVASDGLQEAAASEWDVSTKDFLRTWMHPIDAWDMEADLRSCRIEAVSTVGCDVTTHWQVLEVEIGEQWTFDFAARELTRFEMTRVDSNPMNRTLPLGYSDLQSWELWLEEVHPEEAAGLSSGGSLIWNFYFRYHYEMAEAIGTRIQEYLESRDPLIGTYVCSEGGSAGNTDLWDVRDDGTITRASGETGGALPAGTWSRYNGMLVTNFEGGMTWFAIARDRLVGPGGLSAWTCIPGSSR